ncbi:MAG: feruloyl-CoA synthase [Alphaproteobacteria bacterium]
MNSEASLAHVNMRRFGVDVERRDGNVSVLRCTEPLGPMADSLVALLRDHADAHPYRDFFCEKDGTGDWRRVTYADVRRAADAIGQALLNDGHGPDRPVAILSDNSIAQALFTFGAMTVGIPVMPVSPAYSLMSSDYEKLRGVIEHNDPSVIFVESMAPFEKALAAINITGRRLVVGGEEVPAGADTLADWLETPVTGAVDDALGKVRLDTVGKILLTSGSTGIPKGVMNTHLMMVSNQVAIAQVYAFLQDQPPVFLDWLPWNHTFGGNHNMNMVLHNGGTLYIDEGRPVPGRIEATVENLKRISPTLYLNVPRGFDLLMPILEADAEAREGLFRNLKQLFFAGAALPKNVWDRLDRLAIAARGERVPITASLGSTETAPAATYMNWCPKSAGNIGLPLPGSEIKLVPNGDKLEIRMRGPNITPGYCKMPETTAEAFDEEGFFRIGDAGRFEDDDPEKGIVFDGRVAENFKLITGTWVHAGQLRLQAIAAAAPVVQDAVVTGHDRDQVGLLVFPSAAGCAAVAVNELSPQEMAAHSAVHAKLREGLAAHNAANPGSSTRIKRVLIMTEPPQIDSGEITDKGYINQRAVLSRRADLVERLYTGAGDDIVSID